MTSFAIRVAFAADTPHQAEGVYNALFDDGLATGFAVPMSGDNYTIWLTVDGADPKFAFSTAIDRLNAVGSGHIALKSLEVYEDADRGLERHASAV